MTFSFFIPFFSKPLLAPPSSPGSFPDYSVYRRVLLIELSELNIVVVVVVVFLALMVVTVSQRVSPCHLSPFHSFLTAHTHSQQRDDIAFEVGFYVVFLSLVLSVLSFFPFPQLSYISVSNR